MPIVLLLPLRTVAVLMMTDRLCRCWWRWLLPQFRVDDACMLRMKLLLLTRIRPSVLRKLRGQVEMVAPDLLMIISELVVAMSLSMVLAISLVVKLHMKQPQLVVLVPEQLVVVCQLKVMESKLIAMVPEFSSIVLMRRIVMWARLELLSVNVRSIVIMRSIVIITLPWTTHMLFVVGLLVVVQLTR